MILLSKILRGTRELVHWSSIISKTQNSQFREKLWLALKCCCIARGLGVNSKQARCLVPAKVFDVQRPHIFVQPNIVKEVPFLPSSRLATFACHTKHYFCVPVQNGRTDSARLT